MLLTLQTQDPQVQAHEAGGREAQNCTNPEDAEDACETPRILLSLGASLRDSLQRELRGARAPLVLLCFAGVLCAEARNSLLKPKWLGKGRERS